ncbi:MAG: polyhydroxyalkanoate synthesis repressor PhaR [Rhodospirillales bacterium]|jgi:polyhydroxyalkanoate synthesis repressor PhaR|nr:polyhydroxyalkanoate synthesis repressor PhaR [Rhodospirillales bacterium]MDP6773139.1 polyhydroxyalkanoate synthesis repressor PhaR [Rhodospirillales bacterium]
MADTSAAEKTPITIKKYANRRLYNTATSSYVTLDHLAQMVKEGVEFVVYDAKSGDDITRPVLTQIIVEEEAKGHNLLPVGFLRQLIGFYGDSLQALVPGYLEQTMQAFARNQDQMRHYMRDTLEGLFPFTQFEEMNKQNMAFFESAMNMFTPGGANGANGADKAAGAGNSKAAPDVPDAPDAKGAAAERQLAEMRAKLDSMQKELDSLTGGGSSSA